MSSDLEAAESVNVMPKPALNGSVDHLDLFSAFPFIF